ncbi:serine esterase [Pseudonocardia yuanmonensis]|uniref:Serine esterase n=1 Tax=Pseudonocardia yuanmonensis TaxID=1095914 RepID=A0ABP8WXI2_9PSEU
MQPLARRAVLRGALVALAAAGTGGCTPTPGGLDVNRWMGRDDARLSARPAPVAAPVPGPGLRELDLSPGPQAVLYVPDGPDDVPLRLVLALHGAGGEGRGGIAPLQPFADTHRLLLLGPRSSGSTWDVVLGGWGPDVRRIDETLRQVFATYPVDPGRLAISGFSDGASYALSLGLANADLFTHVIAFSPGFLAPVPRVGAPRVYLAHGRADTVLPIDVTSRRIARRLEVEDVPTLVREFDGPHVVPAGIAEDAVRWFLG